jgi:hypothetical protein
MLEADALRAALLAAAGQTQALVNHLGLSTRAAPTARLAVDTDFRTALRTALQFGRAELVSSEAALGGHGVLAEPCDLMVAGRTRTPQLILQIAWHPRGEDHAGFVEEAMRAALKMSLAKARDAAEQTVVILAAPMKFWRWLPGYSGERPGLDLLDPDPESPVSAKLEFLGGSAWDGLFERGMDVEMPERMWSALLATAEIRSPWVDVELHALEVKGLGAVSPVR